MLIRPAAPADLDALVELFHAARRRQAQLSPVLWRVAADDRARHRPFVSYLLSADTAVALVADAGGARGIDSALIAVRRPDGWLIDDFAGTNPAALADAGRALLLAATERIGPRMMAVAAARDGVKAALLEQEGFCVADRWWVAPASSGPPEPAAGRADLDLAVIAAPPVYDPGGPVAMLSGWDGSPPAARAARAQAHHMGAVLVIAPTPVAERARERALSEAGYEVASQWWARPA
ncbi:MAG: hypothetical protein JWN61_2697 [Pseudonocardiales bacterium]|nr:hypothetical protein [Pseudonocardiales bacterium]